MSRALERHCGEVVHLGPVVAIRERLGRMGSGLSRLLRGRRRAYHHSLALSREYARRFAPRIREDLGFKPVFPRLADALVARTA